MYHPGALAFSTSGGVPKIGQLLNAAWNLSDTCRYVNIVIHGLYPLGKGFSRVYLTQKISLYVN